MLRLPVLPHSVFSQLIFLSCLLSVSVLLSPRSLHSDKHSPSMSCVPWPRYHAQAEDPQFHEPYLISSHPIQIALPQTVTREMVYSPHSFSRLKHSHTTSPARLTTFKDFR